MKTARRKRRLEGIVVSDRMQKTRVVAVTRQAKHPRYRTYFRITSRFKVHDAENQYRIGDKVRIEETRPLSKEKRWVIVSKISGSGEAKKF